MRRALSIVGGLALAFGFAQFPEYAQQYEQRLGGAVDELRIIVDDFDRGAAAFGLSREDALMRYAVSPDEFLQDRGISMRMTLARYERLSADLARLQSAGALERVQLLPRYLDSDVGARALENFEPGVPATGEALAWGLAGFAAGYMLLYPFLGFVTLPFRWRNGQLPARKVPLGRRSAERAPIERKT
ncbi:MAG TPA: DUF2937 family protein [Devosia sp.]|jgi:hypothetical protein|nr:DUF2937 family protein [Devosia sp.]